MAGLSDIEYPLRLCVEMLHYCSFSKKTETMTPSEIRAQLEVFFTLDQIDQSVGILSSDYAPTPPTEDKN